MAEIMESVKVRVATMGIVREWAEASGRTVSGLVNEILGAAASHYLDGTKAGMQLRAEAIGGERDRAARLRTG